MLWRAIRPWRRGVVIGVPDDKWGEVVHAIVQLREGHGASEADIIDHCRRLIAGYKCPRSVTFRTQPFPVSGAGKVLKRELRNEYVEMRGTARKSSSA
ncbi:hypothetical protein [Bradyrhizobium sp. AS23.2]|uniref:AMP-binding enzyme n=1 Tax=Bradyrhizobium sp. AS23.2 TaxID=1680155 RepID=UPI001FDA7903|nr:hypothetical protein [Bradyrhizobium sp. AS23.2]